MLETIAELSFDDYAISVRRGELPDRAEVLFRDPCLIIAMPLHHSGNCVARFLDRPDSFIGPLGGIFVIPPDHRLWMRAQGGGPVRSFNCAIAPRLFERMMAGHGRFTNDQLARALDLRSVAISFCMRHLMEEAIRPRADSRRLTELLVPALLIELSRELFGELRAAPETRRALTAERLEKSMEYIQTFPSGVPSVADVAAQCGLSAQYFSRQFRERTGQSVGRFIAASRLRRAERMLVETDLSLKQIAFRLGFANPAAFSTAFRNEMLVPPGTYREQRRSDIAAMEAKHDTIAAYGGASDAANSAGSPRGTRSA